jgi:hypothetical protein
MKTLRHLALLLLLAALPAAPWAAPESASVNLPILPRGLAPAPAQPPANAPANATKDAGAQAPAGAAAGAKVIPAAPAPAIAPAPAPASTPTTAQSETRTPSAAAKSPVAAPPLSPRFQQVRDRIAELLQHRNATPTPPDPRYSVFRPAGPVTSAAIAPPGADSASAEVETPPPNNDLPVLQQAVALLKVRGTFQMKNGRYQLVINSGPNKEGTYKDGDVINIILQGDSVHLRVRQITLHSVTFTLNDAELKLSF